VISHSNYLKYGLSKIIIKSTQRIRFLKFCINNDIVPKHLYFLHRYNINNLTHYKTHNRYERLNYLHTMRTLEIELNDALRNIQFESSDFPFC